MEHFPSYPWVNWEGPLSLSPHQVWVEVGARGQELLKVAKPKVEGCLLNINYGIFHLGPNY